MRDYVYFAFSKLRFEYFAQILPEIKRFNYSIIKGEALSVQAYGLEGQRFSSDIDILIPCKNISDIENILMFYGFKNISYTRSKKIARMATSHQTIPWRKEVDMLGTITVDINHDVLWGEYEGLRLNMDDFLSDPMEIEIYGLKAKVLPPIKSLIQLVLHHYKDMNSIFLLATRNSIKYEMFRDVYYLLKNNLDKISIERLYALSSEYEIIPYVFYVLYYTGQVFEDYILKEYIEAFRTPEGERLLNLYGLCEKERKEWKVDFNTRMEAENLLPLIEVDLTARDLKKVEINKQIFMGASNE